MDFSGLPGKTGDFGRGPKHQGCGRLCENGRFRRRDEAFLFISTPN